MRYFIDMNSGFTFQVEDLDPGHRVSVYTPDGKLIARQRQPAPSKLDASDLVEAWILEDGGAHIDPEEGADGLRETDEDGNLI